MYLKVSLDELRNRLKDIKERGVVLKDGESLEGIIKTRSELYEKYADITILEEGASIEDTVSLIIDGLNSKSRT